MMTNFVLLQIPYYRQNHLQAKPAALLWVSLTRGQHYATSGMLPIVSCICPWIYTSLENVFFWKNLHNFTFDLYIYAKVLESHISLNTTSFFSMFLFPQLGYEIECDIISQYSFLWMNCYSICSSLDKNSVFIYFLCLNSGFLLHLNLQAIPSKSEKNPASTFQISYWYSHPVEKVKAPRRFCQLNATTVNFNGTVYWFSNSRYSLLVCFTSIISR